MNNLKEINIKNRICYYFDDIIKIEDFDFESYEYILVYDILCKVLIGAKSLRIIFVKADGFIRVYGGTRYLVLFGPENYNAI